MSAPPPTPRGMRVLAAVAMILASAVGAFSMGEALAMSDLQAVRDAGVEAAEVQQLPQLREALVAMKETQVAALEGMKRSRTGILALLAVLCTGAFITSGMLVRFEGVPREGIRKVTSSLLIGAAVMRVVDGAQAAVLVERSVRAALPKLAELSPTDPVAEALHLVLPWVMPALSIGFTALIAGGFLVLGQYFRSEKVKAVVRQQDEALEREGL